MIILDCDAALAMTLSTEEGIALRGLKLADEEIVSTSYIHAELASALAKYVRAGIFDKGLALRFYDDAIRLNDRFIPLEENIVEALAEGLRLGHSPYDMLYFTLARRFGATLLTLDRKLISLCEQEGIDCVHVMEDD